MSEKVTSKIYCYVDESGQHTQGKLFIVSIVLVTGEDRDAYRSLCERVEKESGKNRVKWVRAAYTRNLNYIARIVDASDSVGKLFYALYRDTDQYMLRTTETIAMVFAAVEFPHDTKATILIDGLPKAHVSTVGRNLRQAGILVDKVRGINDQGEALIRLADAVAGLVKAADGDSEEMRNTLKQGLDNGAITKLE
jgi:hypothetical protein